MLWRLEDGRRVPRLVTSYAVDPVDSDEVPVDDVHDPVPADAQTMVSTPMECFRWIGVTGQSGDGRSDGAHAVLVVHVTPR
jgi:hypothetical protein